MLKLFVKDADVSSGSIPISWCIDPDTIAKLKKEGHAAPGVRITVISLTDPSSSTKSYVFPIKDIMGYVPFNRSGKHLIFGTIVQNFYYEKNRDHEPSSYNYYSFDEPFEEFVSKAQSNGDDLAILKHFRSTSIEGSHWRVSDFEYSATKEVLFVNVPKECFAKEPNAWEKAWVNAMFKEKPVDQCDFRRRRLWAYSIQPIIWAILFAFRVALFIPALLTLQREMSFDYFRVFSCDAGDAFNTLFGRGSILRLNRYTDWKKYILYPLMPCISIPLILIVLFTITGSPIASWFAIILLFTIAASITFYLGYTYCFVPWEQKRQEERKEWFEEEDTLDMLTCGNPKTYLSLKDLPTKKRTLTLKYMTLKNKVCKPFAR